MQHRSTTAAHELEQQRQGGAGPGRAFSPAPRPQPPAPRVLASWPQVRRRLPPPPRGAQHAPPSPLVVLQPPRALLTPVSGACTTVVPPWETASVPGAVTTVPPPPSCKAQRRAQLGGHAHIVAYVYCVQLSLHSHHHHRAHVPVRTRPGGGRDQWGCGFVLRSAYMAHTHNLLRRGRPVTAKVLLPAVGQRAHLPGWGLPRCCWRLPPLPSPHTTTGH